MKLSHLIAAGTAATIAYLGVKNHKKIIEETSEMKELIHRMQNSSKNIQQQLTFLQSNQEPVKEMFADFQQSVKVYQQSIAGNLSEIKRIQEKYQSKKEE